MSENKPDFLSSTLLNAAGFRHAFFTRVGGVSAAPFSSLNLSFVVGDDPRAVEQNLSRAAQAVGVTLPRLFFLSQVHGATVVKIDGTELVDDVRRCEGDALVAPAGPHACAVRIADCMPILLADPSTRLVAAVHAGWRGVVANVVGATLDRLVREGALAGDVIAAIGPHISVDAFEVGEDVAEALARAAGTDTVVRRRAGARPHVDLLRIVRGQLAQAGVKPESVDFVGGCTFSDPDRFFSFRRDGRRSGRHLAAISGAR